MIYILSDPIQSGKSTALIEWNEGRNDTGGFLAPDINGSRYLVNARTKEIIDFEAPAGTTEPCIEVGMFVLLENAFDTGHSWITEHLEDDKVKFIILDELGKLELNKKGFYKTIKMLLESGHQKKIIIVIRDYILKKALRFFSINEYKLVQKEALDSQLV